MAAVVYRFKDAEGQLLYIGRSSNMVQRLMLHESQAPWFGQVQSITVEHFTDMPTARDAEREAIYSEAPRYNVDFQAPLNKRAAQEAVATWSVS